MPSQIEQGFLLIVVNAIMLLLNFGLLRLNARFSKFSLFDTANAFTLFWICLILGAQLSFNGSITAIVLVLLYVIPILFNLIQLLIRVLVINQAQYNIQPLEHFNLSRINNITTLLFILCLIANLGYIYTQYYQKGIAVVALEQIRSSNFRNDTEEPNLFFNLFGRIYLLLIPWFYYLHVQNKMHLSRLILLVSISLLLSGIHLTRAPILIVGITIVLCNAYFLKATIAKKANAVLLILTLLLFTGLTLIIDAGLVESNPFIDTAKLYLFGGISAFQKLVQGAQIKDALFPNHLYSLDFVYYIEKKLGFIQQYPTYIRPYVDFGGKSTNVYTFLDCFYLDWGLLGVLLGSSVLFVVIALLNQLAKSTGKMLFFQLHLLCFSNLMMCFMNNEFIRISFYIMVCEALACYYLFTKQPVAA